MFKLYEYDACSDIVYDRKFVDQTLLPNHLIVLWPVRDARGSWRITTNGLTQVSRTKVINYFHRTCVHYLNENVVL